MYAAGDSRSSKQGSNPRLECAWCFHRAVWINILYRHEGPTGFWVNMVSSVTDHYQLFLTFFLHTAMCIGGTYMCVFPHVLSFMYLHTSHSPWPAGLAWFSWAKFTRPWITPHIYPSSLDNIANNHVLFKAGGGCTSHTFGPREKYCPGPALMSQQCLLHAPVNTTHKSWAEQLTSAQSYLFPYHCRTYILNHN